MELLKAIILGVVQGATEFLPVSSSGHLVIGSELLHFSEQGIVFDVFLHLGTLFSVMLFFRRELLLMAKAPVQMMAGQPTEEIRKYFWWDVYVVLATIPAIIVGLGLKDDITSLFTNVLVVYGMLSITGVIMVCSRYLTDRGAPVNGWRALLIGCAQAAAILPGLSRSGSTIFTGMVLGVNRDTAARFSFIMSIPAILGAVVLQARELVTNPPSPESFSHIAVGTLVSAVAGYFAIVLLLDVVKKNRLQWFGYYCLTVSCLGMAHYFFY